MKVICIAILLIVLPCSIFAGEKFDKMTPSEHLKYAQDAISKGQIPVAKLHLDAIPKQAQEYEEAKKLYPKIAQMSAEAQAKAQLVQKEKIAKDNIAKAMAKDYQKLAGRCVEAIKSQLHDPKGAELPDAYSYPDYPEKFYVGQQEKGVIIVQFDMRARNAFNALRRTTAECQWRIDNNGYKLIKVHNF